MQQNASAAGHLVQAHASPSLSALSYPFAQPPASGVPQAVAAGVYWLRLPLPFALDHINVWLLRDASGWTLVDCGLGDQATTTLWEENADSWLKNQPLRRIVVTHCHPDHLGQAKPLADRFGAPVWMSQGEYLSAHAMHGQTAGFGVEPLLELFAAHGMAQTELAALSDRGNRYRQGVPELPRRYHRLADGDAFEIDGKAWKVMVGLGHSPEHLALHCPERGLLISGDMLLPKITTNVSVWPAEPEADPLGRFLRSIQGFAELPASTLILPSHGLPFRGAAARIAQLEAHHEARLAELLGAMGATPLPASQLRRVLFPRDLDLQQLFFAMGETIAHLNHLVTLGRAEQCQDGSRFLYKKI